MKRDLCSLCRPRGRENGASLTQASRALLLPEAQTPILSSDASRSAYCWGRRVSWPLENSGPTHISRNRRDSGKDGGEVVTEQGPQVVWKAGRGRGRLMHQLGIKA